MFRIVEDKMPPIPEGCSEPLQDFLKCCFHKSPAKRPSAEVLREHPWLRENWIPQKVCDDLDHLVVYHLDMLV